MEENILREKLSRRGFDENKIGQALETIAGFEEYLKTAALDPSDKNALTDYCSGLIRQNKNNWYNIFALAVYGKSIGCENLTINALELLDGSEALWNLRDKLDEAFGETAASKYYEGVRFPELGEPNEVRPEAMGTVIGRVESNLGQGKTASLIGGCLRNIKDSWYEEDIKLFDECGKDIDKFIKTRGDRFLSELETLKNEGNLYFTQPITDEVIEFVKSNPEIHYGVRDGNIFYDTKIPHQAAKMLSESDPVKRRYHYCHCPWVKESLANGKSPVPPVFCNCSAGFHKRMWEVILGKPVKCEVLESVLKGDDRCRFKIDLS
ncbi:MAG: hypothetical protein ABFD23_06425 [Caldisericales bacterium]|nr:hypothetical protein [bacterium]